MLEKVLAIAGKPGLYKLLSGTKKMIIVESLIDKKRQPAYANERIIALNDIAIYTENEEIALREVFDKIKTKEGGKAVALDAKNASGDELRNYFAQVLPDFDKERVHTSDIKKVILWYNMLIENGMDDFSEPKQAEEEKKNEE